MVMLSQLFVKGLILPAQVRYFVTNAISMGNRLTIPVLRFRTANEATQPLKLSHYSGPILPDFTTPFSPQIKPLNSKKEKKTSADTNGVRTSTTSQSREEGTTTIPANSSSSPYASLKESSGSVANLIVGRHRRTFEASKSHRQTHGKTRTLGEGTDQRRDTNNEKN